MCTMASHIQSVMTLLFLLMICSQAEVPCRVVIHHIHKLYPAGEYFEEHCGCVNGTVQGLNKNNYPFVKFIVKAMQYFTYFCDWKKNDDGHSFVISVRPYLIVREFRCYLHEQVTCTFRHITDLRIPWYIRKYALKIDDEQTVPCEIIPVDADNYLILCRIPITPATWRDIVHSVVVTMTDTLGEQKYEIKMDRREMIEKPWVFLNAKFKMFNDHCCLDWFRTPMIVEILRIKVHFIPLNPRLPELEYVHEGSPDWENWCFNITPHPYQTYNVNFLAKQTNGFVPFYVTYAAGNTTSPATAPSCPPQVLNDGFFYDHGKRQLHIFWMPLDELDVNGPNLTFSVHTNSGQKPQSTRHNSVVFSDWNREQPATVTIWSENTKGLSANNSQLEIPNLTNAKERQAQNVWYHFNNFTITWRPPKQQDHLIGYTVFWCSASPNQQLICNDTDPFHVVSLDPWEHQLQVNQSVVRTIMAVACHYKDKPSGGLTWIDTTLMLHTRDRFFGPVLALVLVAPVVFGLIFIVIRRLRVMSKIKVVLPEFLPYAIQTSTDHSTRAAPVAVPGNFSPKIVLNQALSSMEKNVLDSDLDVMSQTENEIAMEESSSLKKYDLSKDIVQEKQLCSSVSEPTQINLGAISEGTGNYSLSVMASQKIQMDSERNFVERKPKEQPIFYIKKENEAASSSAPVNEKNKDPCPYKRVP